MGWFKHFLFGSAEPEPRVIEHPQLGTLEFDGENYWTGKVVADGFPLEIKLDWEGNGFPPGQDEICVWVVRNFSELHSNAQDRLKQTVEEHGISIPMRFTPIGIPWIWKNKLSEGFVISFTDDQEGYLWRVEFQDRVPIYCGYDT